MNAAQYRFPTLYIPHGGGPCFFMDPALWPKNMWDRMADYLRGIHRDVGRPPQAIVVVSAHWEAERATVNAGHAPPMLFDYAGFPDDTYRLSYRAPGLPVLARRISELLEDSGIACEQTETRGFDHGVFVPFLLAYPEAKIPIVQLSLRRDLDPAAHIAMGRALAPLRDEGVLIIGSGMSYHNLGTMRSGGGGGAAAARFDAWLTQAVENPDVGRRDALLIGWERAPHARDCHPRSEHLAPLFVVAGAAAADRGQRTYADVIGEHAVSAFQFGQRPNTVQIEPHAGAVP
jgi:aromatic ring-opening dioxygenase catalytic subunit (LigB family)